MMIEIRDSVYMRGKPKLVPMEDADEYVGFRSMYGYDEAAVASIEQNGNMKGLNRHKVYSDTLFVDFDNAEQDALEFEKFLMSADFSYEMYDSGNRSIHFHVPIKPMYGNNVPYSQKKFMESNTNNADLSIYRHCGIYRLPNTIHGKTGRKKCLIRIFDGGLLEIKNRPKIGRVGTKKLNPKEAAEMLDRVVTFPAEEGNRTDQLVKIALACKDMLLPIDRATDLMIKWNRNFARPAKNVEIIYKTARNIYGS